MDKDLSKRLLREAGLPVVPFVTMTDRSRIDYATALRTRGSAELFVKPANMGSSLLGTMRRCRANGSRGSREIGTKTAALRAPTVQQPVL